jgi:hypothetical protein
MRKAQGQDFADRGYPLPGEARKKRCSARLALQSVSRRAALPPRRGFGGAAKQA